MQTTIRPANYYASTVKIPLEVEQAILDLPLSDRLALAGDLIEAMKGDDSVFCANTPEAVWLQKQTYDSLLSVLKWVTSELI